MKFSSLSTLRDSKIRRVISWLLLAVCMCATSGVMLVPPLQLPHGKSTGERFPCESCLCGCTSAAHCWDRCCCHTDAEKIAWAEDHGVVPPAFLIERVTRVSLIATSQDNASCGSCCRAKGGLAQVESGQPGTSVGRELDGKDKDVDGKDVESGSTVRLVSFIKMAECRGLSHFWNLLMDSYVGEFQPACIFALSWTAFSSLSNETPIGSPDAPDPPVPWSTLRW